MSEYDLRAGSCWSMVGSSSRPTNSALPNVAMEIKTLHETRFFKLVSWAEGHKWKASAYQSPVVMMASWITHTCQHWATPIEISYGSHPYKWSCGDCEEKVPDELKALYILHNGLI